MAEIEQLEEAPPPPMIEGKEWRHLKGLRVVDLSEDPISGVMVYLAETPESKKGFIFFVQSRLVVGTGSIHPELTIGSVPWFGGSKS